MVDSHLNLGAAMTISGAAAAPNMGTITIKPPVFLMWPFLISDLDIGCPTLVK